jgi:hypothetical protein
VHYFAGDWRNSPVESRPPSDADPAATEEIPQLTYTWQDHLRSFFFRRQANHQPPWPCLETKSSPHRHYFMRRLKPTEIINSSDSSGKIIPQVRRGAKRENRKNSMPGIK